MWGGGGRSGEGQGFEGLAPGSGGGASYWYAGSGGQGRPGLVLVRWRR